MQLSFQSVERNLPQEIRCSCGPSEEIIMSRRNIVSFAAAVVIGLACISTISTDAFARRGGAGVGRPGVGVGRPGVGVGRPGVGVGVSRGAVGRRYGAGIWYGTGRRFWRGQWHAYGVGPCWALEPVGYVWICR